MMCAQAEFVQIGDQIFNRRHVVALVNAGKRATTVVTRAGDMQVDVKLSLAADALGIGDFSEVAP